MTKKPLITAGLTLGVAALSLTVGSFVVPQGSTASAQGLAKQSYKSVAGLSPAEKGKLTQNIGANAEDQLREAQSAKDLEVLTYDQVMSKYKDLIEGPASIPAGKAPDLHGLKFLKYTSTQGATVLLGLNSQNMPAFATVLMGTRGAGTGLETFHMQEGGKSSSGPSFSTNGSGQDQ